MINMMIKYSSDGECSYLIIYEYAPKGIEENSIELKVFQIKIIKRQLHKL